MQRWQGLAEVPDNFGPSVVTIGVFDGVHRGHQRIVNRAREAASELGLPVVVVTFDPHPVEVVRPGSHPPFLCTPRRMSELLTGLGVDAACVIEFTLEFSRLDPGDVALLADLGEKYDFTAEGVPLLTEDGVRISSTEIRARLAAGDVEGAAHDLGRPHRVEGVVVRGHQRGRALGFPTANLETLPHTAIPADGVYAGWLTLLDIDGLDAGGSELARWPAAISVGTNPTFDGRERTVEAYALDRDDLDLYGARVAVDFTNRLRATERFDSVPDLVAQMHVDVAQARQLLS
jgi:riboflavin kinase/FMN adenylyltransferase